MASGKPKTVHVRGQQVPVDAANGKYVMRGDLVGDWLYVPRTPPLHSTDTLYVEAGTEVLQGLHRPRTTTAGAERATSRGELRLAFLYWAYYDLDGNLIKGQCTHPITGGTEAFVGARGLLDMVDRPVGDEVKTTYRGEIILNAVPSEVRRTGLGGLRDHHRPPDDGRRRTGGPAERWSLRRATQLARSSRSTRGRRMGPRDR